MCKVDGSGSVLEVVSKPRNNPEKPAPKGILKLLLGTEFSPPGPGPQASGTSAPTPFWRGRGRHGCPAGGRARGAIPPRRRVPAPGNRVRQACRRPRLERRPGSYTARDPRRDMHAAGDRPADPRGACRSRAIAVTPATGLVSSEFGQRMPRKRGENRTDVGRHTGSMPTLLVCGFSLGVDFAWRRARGGRPPGLVEDHLAAALGSGRPSPWSPSCRAAPSTSWTPAIAGRIGPGCHGPEHVLAGIVGSYFGSRSLPGKAAARAARAGGSRRGGTSTASQGCSPLRGAESPGVADRLPGASRRGPPDLQPDCADPRESRSGIYAGIYKSVPKAAKRGNTSET
jgi:hypothetical protein